MLSYYILLLVLLSIIIFYISLLIIILNRNIAETYINHGIWKQKLRNRWMWIIFSYSIGRLLGFWRFLSRGWKLTGCSNFRVKLSNEDNTYTEHCDGLPRWIMDRTAAINFLFPSQMLNQVATPFLLGSRRQNGAGATD